MREYAATSAVNPTKAQHLAEAVIDLSVMIHRIEAAEGHEGAEGTKTAS